MKDYNGIINLNQSDDDYIVYKIYSIDNSDKSIGKEWNSPKRKNVLKYSKEMELISTYTSLLHASQFENAHPVTIGEWCRGEKNPRNGFIYKYQNL